MSAASNSVIHLLGWILNILVSRQGDGNLLHELRSLKAETREARNRAFLLPFLLICITLIGLTRYTLGHTLASILTLQSVYIQANVRKSNIEYVEPGNFNPPLSRYPLRYLRTVYTHQGLCIFVKGFYHAAIYQLLRTAVTGLLTVTVLRRQTLRPVADVLAALLLTGPHMHWTHATISSQSSRAGFKSWTVNFGTWKKLALPCVAQAIAVALLDWVSQSIPDMPAASLEEDMRRTLSAIAVIRVFVALLIRSFVLAPGTAWLTLVEASCLEPGQEALVYEQGKGRFVRMGTVLVGYDRKGSVYLWRDVSMPLCLWLLELHVKKCGVQMVLEGVVAMAVRLLS